MKCSQIMKILLYIVYTPTVTLNEFYMTNHSTPSGHPLTAIYNSLVNLFYKAMIFF